MWDSSLIRQFGFFLAKYCIYCFDEKTIVAFCNFQTSMNKSWAVHASDKGKCVNAMWNIQIGQKYKRENVLSTCKIGDNIYCTKIHKSLNVLNTNLNYTWERVKALLAFKEINIKTVAVKQLFMLKLQQCNVKKKQTKKR